MRNNNKYRYLAKNTVLFTISSFGTSILTFFLVPLYTSRLSTSEFGKADLLSTTVAFLIPILTINVAAAVMRFSIEKPIESKAKLKYGVILTLISSFILLFGIGICYLLRLIPWAEFYYLFLFLLFFFEAYDNLFVQFLRGTDRISIMVICSIISTFVRLTLNIITLVFLKWGVIGYLISMIAGPACSILYSSAFIKPFSVIRNERLDLKNHVYKEMNAYGFMLGINAVGWTIVTSLDKYILTWLNGIESNGVYSVSYKIPTIISALCAIFTQAWSLSAIREYREADEDNFFSQTYNIYNAGLVICCSTLIILNIPLSKILFANDFFSAWKYTPTLIMAMVFNGLSSFLASAFTAVKRNAVLALSTFAAAVANTVLNFIFIPMMGALGAAIATAISFYIVFIIRLIGSRKYIKYRINYIRDYFVYFLIVFQIVIAQEGNKYLLLQSLIIITIFVCYWRIIKIFIMNVISAVLSKEKMH